MKHFQSNITVYLLLTIAGAFFMCLMAVLSVLTLESV